MWNALARLRGRAKKMISIACSFVVALSVVLHSETAALAAQPTVPKDSTAFVGAEPKVATTLNASVMRNIARNPSRVEFQSTQLQAGPSTSSGGKKHGLGGALIGAAVGIGAGFLIAGMTDYPLKEGGGYEVILKGSVIGGVVGLWTGASIGKDWTKTGKTQISLRGAWTTSLAHRDIQNVFKEAGYLPTNSDSWHPYSPSLAVTHEIRKNVSMGVEISGISAQNVRSGTYDLYESVDGTCYGLFLSLAPRPT
ncbi:MAG: hypothetical protein MUF51_09460, partial [Vicinamibacteria bacterium]|nr:hypothetical protein [Vicinamibacteria bacterium]